MFGLFPFADLPAREREIKRGQHLFWRGDRVRYMHSVKWGEIQLVRHQANGAALVLQRAGRGAVVAEPSLFSPAYHCDAIASEPTLVVSVKAADLRAKLADVAFAQAWAAHLAGEMQAARLRAEILSLKTVAERLSAWLEFNTLPDRHGQWKVVAAQIGVSHEALYRELARRREMPAGLDIRQPEQRDSRERDRHRRLDSQGDPAV
ncbi:Crp/Fnr family transcriptional regulator [Alsobacter sp. KACC 23698]|uniref:Crp/Fnr family transcriptional regulator n=1 Tax=Alsobacter sp. KACC 23698 TaxID=3149229 RepID=A0AAU7JGL3_9HYPH